MLTQQNPFVSLFGCPFERRSRKTNGNTMSEVMKDRRRASTHFKRLRSVLRSDTCPTRFWFAIADFGMAVGLFANYQATLLVFGCAMLFVLHATALLYGVFTRRFSKRGLVFEGLLGATIWLIAAAIQVIAMTPNAIIAGAFIATWLLVRYPTRWEYTDGG